MNNEWIIVNGDFRRQEELIFPENARALRYGDGCFETFRSYQGRFLKLEAHLDRLKGAVDYLGIQHPFVFDPEVLREEITDLLDKNNLIAADTVVRIQVWREGTRGFAVPGDASSGYSIGVSSLPDIPKSVKLVTVDTRRIPSESLDPRFKLSNSINYIKASTEAAERGADDALMLTTEGYISETTIANIFWLNDGTVFTPSTQCDILPGITRRLILDILEENFHVNITEGEFMIYELLQADAAWICNSVRELVPVRAVNQHKFSIPHPFFRNIHKAFKLRKNKELV